MKTRIRDVIDRAVSGAAGPDTTLSVVLLCTIQNGDCISAEYTDRTLRPSYSGDRFKQVIAWPQSEGAKKLWAEYVEKRQDGKRLGHDPNGEQANQHYIDNRAVMDAGFEVANPFRFKNGAISAQQHIYNEVADNGWAMVFSEYQNEPKDAQNDTGIPKAEAIERRRNGLKKWVLPPETQVVVAHIDVGQDVLWWTAMAVWGAFAGSVLAYGAWPPQHRSYFNANEVSPTIAEAYKAAHGGAEADLDAMLTWALGQLVGELSGRPLRTEAGVVHNWSKIGVDSGFETETIYRFVRQSPHRAILRPTKGMPLSMKKEPMGAWKKVDGEVRGWNSRIVTPEGRSDRIAEFDANAWKTKLHNRLALPMGSASALTLFGEHGDPRVEHQMFAQHLTAEYRQLVKVGSREGYEYSPKPGKPDNHLLDTSGGCFLLAGFSGISDGGEMVVRKRTSRVAAARKRGL